MKKILLSLALVMASSHSSADVVVFGDSYTDTGNLVSISPEAAYIQSISPLYENGAFTNEDPALVRALESEGYDIETSNHFIGPVSGNNFSVASGRLSLPGTNALSYSMQINSFLASDRIADTDLAVSWIGTNDVRDAARSELLTSFFERKDYVDAAIVDYKSELSKLVANSDIEKLVLLGVPDISTLPEIAFLEAEHPNIKRTSFWLSLNFNIALAKMSAQLAHDYGIEVVYVPIAFPARAMLRSSEFVDPQGYCMTLLITEVPEVSEFCAEGFDLDVLPFVDEIHFSGQMNQHLANYIRFFL